MKKRLVRTSGALVLLTALALVGLQAAYAAPQTLYISAQSGDWSDSATWGGAGTPGAGDLAIIQSGHAVSVDGTRAADTVLINGGTLQDGTGTSNLTAASMTIYSGGSFTGLDGATTITSTLEVKSGGSFAAGGSVTVGNLTNYGVCNGNTYNVAISGNLSNYGTFNAGSGSWSVQGNLFNSGTLTATSGALWLQGNFSNSGTFAHNGGTVVFSGGTQNLSASVATTFNDLTVNAGTTLVESASANNVTVSGTLTNNGVIRKTQSIPSTGVYTFGLAGGPINGGVVSINVITDSFTSIMVSRVDQNHPFRTGDESNPGVGWGVYWTITPMGSGGVNLTLPTSFTPDENDKLCRHTGGGGAGWDCAASSYTANTITRDGVTVFSDWAAGNDVGPTVVTLTRVAARSSGPWLPAAALVAAAVLAGGGLLLARRRRAS